MPGKPANWRTGKLEEMGKAWETGKNTAGTGTVTGEGFKKIYRHNAYFKSQYVGCLLF